MNYINEINPAAAQILRCLVEVGAIAPAIVDERSIEDVTPNDLRGFTQCHFFAGIGGWCYALDLAGWPRSRPVWTGSPPCQPFSAAGKRLGFEDERHLWAAWEYLIAVCLPPEILGEQIAGKDIDPWIDLVQSDLEGLGYAFGCIPFAAAGIGAPFAGERTYWGASRAEAERHQQPREEPRCWTPGRMGRVEQPVPWNTPWPDSLAILRVLDDGLPRSVAATDAARNAIVPQQAAAFVSAYMEARGLLALEAAA